MKNVLSKIKVEIQYVPIPTDDDPWIVDFKLVAEGADSPPFNLDKILEQSWKAKTLEALLAGLSPIIQHGVDENFLTPPVPV
jgi:hypothetical protein